MIHDILDLHTHTIMSGHAYNTMQEMLRSASEKGVKLLGITEHAQRIPGACHPFYFINFKVVPRQQFGVKLMLGCELNNIRTMFLFEAGAIGLLGGIVGVAFSYLLSFILNNVSSMMMGGDGMSSGLLDAFGSLGASGGQISIIPLWLVLAALAFSTLVGLVSGVVPANRAVKISALEAIRRE